MRALVLVVVLAGAAAAQDPSQRPAEPPLSQAFERKALAPAPAAPPSPQARAVALAFGATTWAEVSVSTMGPVFDLNRLVGQGFYKRELIELVLMSAAAKRPLEQAAEKRRKGARLRAIALDYNLDYARIVERALAVEEAVDKRYLPLFPERGPKRWREEL